jgi:hypothetical protein
VIFEECCACHAHAVLFARGHAARAIAASPSLGCPGINSNLHTARLQRTP